MKRVLLLGLAAVLFSVCVYSKASAQFALNCDSGCGGATSTNTGTMATARAALTASRGVATRTSFAQRVGKTVAVSGSNSFTYAVPLFSLPGRGINTNLTLYYNSFIWTASGTSITLNADRDTPSYGFRLDFGFIELTNDGSGQGTLMDANGVKHLLTQSSTLTYDTTDSSYIQVQMPTTSGGPVVASYASGLKVSYQSFTSTSSLEYRPYQIEDTNGNIISIAYLNNNNLLLQSVTDTVGRKINFIYEPTGTMLSCVTTGSTCNAAGAKTFNFSWNSNYVLNFNFTRFVGTSLHSGSTVLNVLTGVTRPDGTRVQFGYGDWAIVNQIQELSASGVLRYSTAFDFPAASAGALRFNPTYAHQTVFDGVNQATWVFQGTINTTTGLVTSMAITDPLGTTTTTTFSSSGDWRDGLPLQRQIATTFMIACTQSSPPGCQGGTSTVVYRTINQTWTSDVSGANPRPATSAVVLEDNTTQNETVFNTYDANGNITDLLEYDFGSGAHSALLRETLTTYAPLANHILNRVADLQIKDANGSLLYHKKLNYDETSLTTVTGTIPGRDPNFSATARGNLTSTVVYANAASSANPITSTFTYDSLGNEIASQSGCCTFSQHTFSSATQYAYLDSVTTGPVGSQFTTHFTYNMDTGTVATTTDPNGLSTSNTYDVDNRTKTTQMPDGVTLTNIYDDTSSLPSITSSNSANNLQRKTVFDAMRRALTLQALDGTVPVSTRTFTYDALGRLTQASNPFTTDAPVYTTYQYDVLGRNISITPPAQNNNVSQNSYQVSYSGLTATYSDPAGRQRKQYVDGLGRLIRIDEPGLINGQFASASTTISGTEQSTTSTSTANGATAGKASITINAPSTASCSSAAADRCTQVLTHPATSGSVTVTIGGGDNSEQVCQDALPPHPPICRTVWDTGSIQVNVTVGSAVISQQASYTQNTSASALASALANSFSTNNGATFAVAYTAGSTSFTLTAKATGAATNYPISYSISSAQGGSGFCVTFSTTCVSSSSGSGSFANGTDNGYTTVYDTGTVSVSVVINGTTYTRSATYGQNSTANSVAADLYTGFSDQTMNQLLIANLSGNVLSLTTVAAGANTNYPLSVTAATTSSNFTAGSSSFTATPSGSTFTPGQNGTLYDSGTITATLTGFSQTPFVETVNFGQGSTPASVAATIASAFHSDPYSPVDASVTSGNATISFTAKTQGLDANNFAINIAEHSAQSSSFASLSFPSQSAQFGGGVEPVASLDPSVVLSTTYTYDAMGDLLQTHQGQQTRTYIYDSLGRVTSETIPETGYQTTTLTYTDSGELSQVIDPRLVAGTNTHVTTTYGYDSLQRLQSATYNDGTPNISYTYNPAGSANNTGLRLASVSNGVASESYQYDLMGRPLLCSKSIGGQTYNIGYSYHTDGTLATITYPSGRIVSTDEDDIGRTSQIRNNGAMLVSVGAYNPAGEILNETYGNGITGTYAYDNQLQRTSLQYVSSAGAVLNLTYSHGAADDNGRIIGVTDNLVSARSTSYFYDELGRLKSAQTNDLTSANTWKLKYSYDRYGNRLSEIPVAGTAGMPLNEVLIDPTTNHIISSGYSYDAAGNMTSDGLFSYKFDAAGQMTSVTPSNSNTPTATFGYDPKRLRVIKNSTVYIYSGRKVIAEYANGAAATSPSIEHIYRGELRVASIAAGNLTYHYADHQSVRVDTNAAATPLRSYGSYPFGGTWYETPTQDKWQFTTYESDSESGLNYATNRYHSPRLGRFMSLDPLPGYRSNPQSLNRYAYVGNDPINLVDPTGAEGEEPCGPFEDCNGNYAQLQDEGPGEPGGADTALIFDGSFFNVGTPDSALDVFFCGICPDGLVLPGMFLQQEDVEPDPDLMREERDMPEESPWITMEPGETLDDIFGPAIRTAEAELGNRTFDMMNPGPLPDSIASTFSGGRYTKVEVGPDGWFMESARVFGGSARETGRGGTFYNPTPQVGGIQSLIDNAILPQWGNTAQNTASVYLPPGTTVYIGISSTQGGFYVGGNIQIYVPQ